MKGKIGIAIVGAGNVANSMHLPSWTKIPEAKVVAVCDVNKENAEKTAKKWKIPKVYTDFDELLEKERGAIAVMDICTPPSTHAPLSIKAMEASFHVLLEKPMAMSLEESEKILREYQRRKDEVRLCIIHNYLFSPSMLKIKSALEKNKVDVLGVDIRMLHTPQDEMISDRNHWVHSLPGGRFGECLIHPIYLLHNLIGKLNVRDVHAWKRGSYEWVKYDELLVTFDSGERFGSIYISFNSPRETSFPTVRVYGRNLILSFDGTNSTFTIQKSMDTRSNIRRAVDSLNVSMQLLKSMAKNALEVVTGKWRLGHENLFRFFVNSILKGNEVPYSPEEAFEANKTFLEVLKRLP
jgi:predicted dehydrogenase